MFFKREKPRVPTFGERMEELRKQGFAVEPDQGGMRASKNGCAAVITDQGNGAVKVAKAGLLLGKEIGALVDAGFQKYWLAPSGVRAAATAEHLKALHNFEEDLREALGLISLYNEALGTVNELHLYDRVQDRDRGVPRRPWER
ncbi:MAG: hypothetical protein NZV14_16590 [Bryobacteraceae bacterium]|nr:hypothetical protein [Bryobacteraceae bacterium]MDW8379779.1 hypothetical protein [Bryobacterales bacterium]